MKAFRSRSPGGMWTKRLETSSPSFNSSCQRMPTQTVPHLYPFNSLSAPRRTCTSAIMTKNDTRASSLLRYLQDSQRQRPDDPACGHLRSTHGADRIVSTVVCMIQVESTLPPTTPEGSGQSACQSRSTRPATEFCPNEATFLFV